MDLMPLLWTPDTGYPRRNVNERNPLLAGSDLGDRLAAEALAELDGDGAPVRLRYAIRNTDRTIASRLSDILARRHGNAGLPEGSIVVELKARPARASARSSCLVSICI